MDRAINFGQYAATCAQLAGSSKVVLMTVEAGKTLAICRRAISCGTAGPSTIPRDQIK
jgi:hypothetical protein